MRRAWQISVVLGALLAMTAAAPATTAGADATARNSARGRAALEERVRRELVRLPYFSVFDNLEYRVDDYRVTLSGQVTRPSLRSGAEKVVKRLEGVESVVNNIEVLPASFNDDRIRRASYRAIFSFNGPLHRYSVAPVPSIHIIVKRGHVTLVGVVANEGDSNFAYIRARGVPGSFSVTNRLRVEN